MINTVTAYLDKALKSRQTGSALSPLLWINGIITVPCLLISATIKPPMNIAFFCFAVAITGFSLIEYRALRKKDPRLLQSEKFQFELAKLDIVASKGGAVVFDPVSLEFSTEPVSRLEQTEDDEEK